MWDGAANKNLGSAFLLVWNIEDEQREIQSLSELIVEKTALLRESDGGDATSGAMGGAGPKYPMGAAERGGPSSDNANGGAAPGGGPMDAHGRSIRGGAGLPGVPGAARQSAAAAMAHLQDEFGRSTQVSVLADKALIAFLKIHIQVGRRHVHIATDAARTLVRRGPGTPLCSR